MRSSAGWTWLILGGIAGSARSAVVPSPPLITPAPVIEVDVFDKRQLLDAVSFAQILLTAIPASLRQLAATNAAAASSVLNSEFLDDNKPQWFLDLPSDVQSYLVRQFGPSTAWQTSSPTASSSFSSSASFTPSDSTLAASATASRSSSLSRPTQTLTNGAESQSQAEHHGLSNVAKIGLGVGIPLAVFAIIGLVLLCCCLLRRRRRAQGKHRASSPGFIPRFAFQDKSAEHVEHRAPLNSTFNRSTGYLGAAGGWEDRATDPYESTHHAHHNGPMSGGSEKLAMAEAGAVMAPALTHTHTSNRARGMRTSYTSLHSVAEVAEPEEPVPGHRAARKSPRLGLNTAIAAIPAAAAIKRKPVASSPTEGTTLVGSIPTNSPRDQSHSRSRSSNSSGFAPLSVKSNRSSSASNAVPESPISPLSPSSKYTLVFPPTANDLSGSHNPQRHSMRSLQRNSYVEDYGPEFSNGYTHDNPLDNRNDGLDRYPPFHKSPTSHSPHRQMPAKTEWPLRNILGTEQSRVKSPEYDRVYE